MTTIEQLISTLWGHAAWQKAATNHLLDLAGCQASWQTRRMHAIGSLADVEFKVYSQWGEDGIIDWLIEHIAVSAEQFIEFGVESYAEANTRFLLGRRNWKGLVIDGSPDCIAAIKSDPISWQHDLTALAHFITRENINAVLERGGLVGPVGLLSIDIDGMDYWVWEQIDVVHPDIIVCEYNGAFGNVHPITVPYNPDFNRTRAHHSGWYFGASIAALCHLATSKGYSLIGTNSAGCNAFFLLDEHYRKLADCVVDKRPRAPRFRISRDEGGQLDYKTALEMPELLKAMPVVSVDTRQVAQLGELGQLFSDEWVRYSSGAR